MDGQHIKHTHSQASEKEEQEKEKCISINPIFLFSIHWREKERSEKQKKVFDAEHFKMVISF